MKSSPRKIVYLISRLVLALSAVFSALNVMFIHLNIPRMMPMALSMTGYLTSNGCTLTAEKGMPFFSIFSTSVSGIICLALLLCALLAGINRGWLLAGGLIVLADCIGTALVILANGYRSGYWFEIAGHVVLLVALVIAFCTMPRRKNTEQPIAAQ